MGSLAVGWTAVLFFFLFLSFFRFLFPFFLFFSLFFLFLSTATDEIVQRPKRNVAATEK